MASWRSRTAHPTEASSSRICAIYTSFVERYGDTAASALLDRYRALVRSIVAQYGGAEVKTEGDSFFVVFPSASSAVRWRA